MPDSTIFAQGGAGGEAQPDSYVENSLSTFAGGASWAGLVADSTGNNHNDSATTFDEGVHNGKFMGRGTSNTWECNRSFFAFDLSGESSTVASAQFKVKSDNLGDTGTNQSTVYLVAWNELDGDTGDFDDDSFFLLTSFPSGFVRAFLSKASIKDKHILHLGGGKKIFLSSDREDKCILHLDGGKKNVLSSYRRNFSSKLKSSKI